MKTTFYSDAYSPFQATSWTAQALYQILCSWRPPAASWWPTRPSSHTPCWVRRPPSCSATPPSWGMLPLVPCMASGPLLGPWRVSDVRGILQILYFRVIMISCLRKWWIICESVVLCVELWYTRFSWWRISVSYKIAKCPRLQQRLDGSPQGAPGTGRPCSRRRSSSSSELRQWHRKWRSWQLAAIHVTQYRPARRHGPLRCVWRPSIRYEWQQPVEEIAVGMINIWIYELV